MSRGQPVSVSAVTAVAAAGSIAPTIEKQVLRARLPGGRLPFGCGVRQGAHEHGTPNDPTESWCSSIHWIKLLQTSLSLTDRSITAR